MKEWNSIVYYHCNTPRWNETFKLNIPPQKYPDYHIFFSASCHSINPSVMADNHTQCPVDG